MMAIGQPCTVRDLGGRVESGTKATTALDSSERYRRHGGPRGDGLQCDSGRRHLRRLAAPAILMRVDFGARYDQRAEPQSDAELDFAAERDGGRPAGDWVPRNSCRRF